MLKLSNSGVIYIYMLALGIIKVNFIHVTSLLNEQYKMILPKSLPYAMNCHGFIKIPIPGLKCTIQ